MAAPVSITIATFNVRHARPPRGFARLGRLVEQCRALHANVIGMQELVAVHDGRAVPLQRSELSSPIH